MLVVKVLNFFFQAKEQGFNDHKAEIEVECPYTDCEWSEKGKKGSIQKSNLIKHLGIYHKLLDVCYEECKEQPPPPSPKSDSPTPPKKKMSLSDYKKKRTETNQNDAPKFAAELEKEYENNFWNEEHNLLSKIVDSKIFLSFSLLFSRFQAHLLKIKIDTERILTKKCH